MNTFKDSEGREWRLKLSIGTVYRIEEETGYNLGDETGKQPSSLKDWGNVLFEMVRPEVLKFHAFEPTGNPESDQHRIKSIKMDFFDAMEMPNIKAAIDVLQEEMNFFSPEEQAALPGPKPNGTPEERAKVSA